ncbi:putative RNA-directed DNA polymerase from transposon X-element [Trichonephila clavipes]|nr:putative RNA-directed DNA polymerase from transposon X-element [Trichonephila clavipes]
MPTVQPQHLQKLLPSHFLNRPHHRIGQQNSPAVRETFDLLEEFVKIAHTIPTKYKHLQAIKHLLRDEDPTLWLSLEMLMASDREFRSFIVDWNPDIVNLQETHLQPCNNFIFPYYSIYRTDRTYHREGTAIMIKRISVYRPPRKPITEQDLHQIFRNQGYIVVAGDLNAKHASWGPLTQQNMAGNIVRRFCDSTGYSLNAPPEPTLFHRSCRSTTIDIAICKGMTITDCTSIPKLSSDHNPVLFEVSLDNYTSSALSQDLLLS